MSGGGVRKVLVAVIVTGCLAAGAQPAHAAASCSEPSGSWQRASPAAAGMDATRLQDAMDYGTANLGFAVRVYRNGCLVAGDRLEAANRNTKFESWSMAKSVTSLMFGRAVQMGLISPDDPVGSLVPEADGAHGRITMRQLLTMTSGLHWNGLRDYNIFTMPDRIRDALTLGVDHPPGTFFEYAQSPVSLLAEAIGRSAGKDAGAYVQSELMDPLGIKRGSWYWTRDPAGHIGGFYGVNMRPDDYGRLGELMRRGGRWKGDRLLSKTYMHDAITPTPTNGCYGWLIWLNRDAPCVGPTITERPVDQEREFPDLPADIYRFSGLFGQLVTVFPSQGIVVVRTGQDAGLVFSGGTSWEHELYRKVLGSVTDQKIDPPVPPAGGGPKEKPNADYGFQTALLHPDQYGKGLVQAPLPPAGPTRARAARLGPARVRVTPRGYLRVRVGCPPRWVRGQAPRCRGWARMDGARRIESYSVPGGRNRVVKMRLTAKALQNLRRAGALSVTLRSRNPDPTGGTTSVVSVELLKAKSKAKAK